jgi:hypothetical protein
MSLTLQHRCDKKNKFLHTSARVRDPMRWLIHLMSPARLMTIIYYYCYHLNCKWAFTRWQWYYNKTQHKNTRHTKYHTTLKQNTKHKATQIIKGTLHTMNTTQNNSGSLFNRPWWPMRCRESHTAHNIGSKFETSQTWRPRSLYFHLSRRRWFSYTPRHWVGSCLLTGCAFDTSVLNSGSQAVAISLIWLEVEGNLQPTVSRPVSLGVGLSSRNHVQILFLSHNCGYLDIGLPLWREDWSVIYSYNYFWALPE